MKFEKGQPDNSSNEWSPLQPGAEAASSPFGETGKADKKDKDSKKKSSTAITPEDVARAFGGKGKEWRQKLELPTNPPAAGETAHPSELPEGLIWLRAASTVQQQRLQAEQQAKEYEATDEAVKEAAAVDPTEPVETAARPADQHTTERIDTRQTEVERPATPDTASEAPVEAEPTNEAEKTDETAEAEETGAAAEYPGQPQHAPQAGRAEHIKPPESNGRPAGFVPPLPPDPMQYRHFFWNEQPSPEAVSADSRVSLPPVYEYRNEYQHQMAAAEVAAPAAVLSAAATEAHPPVYPSPTPPGLQRSASEVSRAAWFGVEAGWFFGRRGKRKAVEKARSDGIAEGRAQPVAHEVASVGTQRLEAEPLHTYPQPAGGRIFVEANGFERPPAASKPVVVGEKPAAVPRVESKASSTPAATESAPSAKSMGKRELLRVAKTIRIEGISLKDVFNAKRIDEAGMRAVVETYLKGGDVRHALTREVVAKEKSFEVDPLSRQYKLDSQRQASLMAAGSADAAANVPEAEVMPPAHGAPETPAQVPKQASSKGALTASSAASTARRVVESGDSVTWLGVTAVVIIYSLIVMLLV